MKRVLYETARWAIIVVCLACLAGIGLMLTFRPPCWMPGAKNPERITIQIGDGALLIVFWVCSR